MAPQGNPLRILFCGNSFMGFYEVDNSLALELDALTHLAESRLSIDWASYRHGGSTIGQRWAYDWAAREDSLSRHNQRDPIRREQSGTLADVIVKGSYDLLLLQQNSKAELITEESRPVIEAARQAGTRVAFMVTWRLRDSEPKDQQRINDNYAAAAQQLGAECFPLGNLWQAIRSELIDRELFIDDKHPISLAHHFNALALYRWLAGSDLSELPLLANKLTHAHLADHEQALRRLINTHIPARNHLAEGRA